MRTSKWAYYLDKLLKIWISILQITAAKNALKQTIEHLQWRILILRWISGTLSKNIAQNDVMLDQLLYFAAGIA